MGTWCKILIHPILDLCTVVYYTWYIYAGVVHVLLVCVRKQKNTLTLRMNASRKAREGRNTLVSRAFSPVQYRMNSRQDREGKPSEKAALRSQRSNE